jgi:pimeloyl-ACP methyl ester carboxylesterase
VLTITCSDGTDVRAYDEGKGPAIVMLGPGLDDGTRTKKLAAILAGRYRVLRLHRRQYRLDLKADPKLGGSPVSIAQEVEDVLAVVRAIGEPALLYGHSDGGVVALEALAASPSSFAGAVVYEPAAVIDEEKPLAGKDGRVLAEARAALAAGRPGKAAAIFIGDTIELPPWQAWLAGMGVALIPHYRRLMPCQLDSMEALDRLGVRLDTYAHITVPTVLLGGDRGPAHITQRLEAVARVMPHAERVVMRGRDHGADLKHPKQVAGVIEAHAIRVGLRSGHEIRG